VNYVLQYKINSWLPKLQKVPLIGKALAAFGQSIHVMIVYQMVIKEGEKQCQSQKANPQPRNNVNRVTR